MNKRSAEETKRNILAATRKVFAEQGYEQASMRTIAREAGVSVGGLYLYFRSKEEIYLTLTQEWMEELNAMTVKELASMKDPRDAIAAFIRISIDYALKRKEMILLQGKELGFTFGSDLKKKFFRDRRGLIVTIINKGIDNGVFRDCDAEETAKVIFGVLRGFIVSMLFDEEALFTSEECENLVLNGLVRRDSA